MLLFHERLSGASVAVPEWAAFFPEQSCSLCWVVSFDPEYFSLADAELFAPLLAGRLASFSAIRTSGGCEITPLKRLCRFFTLGDDDVGRQDLYLSQKIFLTIRV